MNVKNEKTKQMKTWSGEFGKDYTDRNPQTVDELNALYQTRFGVTRSTMNEEFLRDLDREVHILEVGANVGVQLQTLQVMGFENLYGVELQRYAVEKAKASTAGIDIIQGSAFDVPFKDGYFDLVYTSGVLIHINPNDLSRVLDEIYRCSKRLIWGFEYFAEAHTSVPYRGCEDLLWKGDFAGLYKERFPDLLAVKEKRRKYVDGDDLDTMYLLEKQVV